MNLLHILSPAECSGLVPPKTFNNPFHYTPDALCLLAQQHVMDYVAANPTLERFFAEGKMLGVLVVRRTDGWAFLAAYSGCSVPEAAEYFVPPIFDLNAAHSFYSAQDTKISTINEAIKHLEQQPERLALLQELSAVQCRSKQELSALKEMMLTAKQQRDERRAHAPKLSAEEAAAMIRESQFQKAELKRRKERFLSEIQAIEQQLKRFDQEIATLKQQRKALSIKLQTEIFRHFEMHNALGARRSLLEIFRQYDPKAIPPAGAGECAAPRLLEFAYQHRLIPVAMSEFWYGRPTKESNRKHGCCYPACQEKCAPILSFMLQGLHVAELPNPTAEPAGETLEVVYEDPFLLIVNKPSGLLSVPGKEDRSSVQQLLTQRMATSAPPLLVHRLDMDTSGLLVVAKDRETFILMQRLFAERKVEKEYQAWLSRPIFATCGLIRLPLSPDFYHRPLQRVDSDGKPAITYFEVIRRTETATLVRFSPLTGRTHQLRVHASHHEGLNAHIQGDPLYGIADDAQTQKLCLHAAGIKFRHPRTGKIVEVLCNRWESSAPEAVTPYAASNEVFQQS
jgi:tRNA pseudouridine32 synthase/23S rRNA pseudouridine746 synthase